MRPLIWCILICVGLLSTCIEWGRGALGSLALLSGVFGAEFFAGGVIGISNAVETGCSLLSGSCAMSIGPSTDHFRR